MRLLIYQWIAQHRPLSKFFILVLNYLTESLRAFNKKNIFLQKFFMDPIKDAFELTPPLIEVFSAESTFSTFDRSRLLAQ